VYVELLVKHFFLHSLELTIYAADALLPSSALLNSTIHMSAAASASALATIATHPFDVIKVCCVLLSILMFRADIFV
jgi:hypothetical protein